MINGSFVFGLDGDDRDVFARTVDWAVAAGLTTATFHILTPYPGTPLYADMHAAGRITSRNWDRYDTRHVVYRPLQLTPAELEHGYDRAYETFYRWDNIVRAAATHTAAKHCAKHLFYSAGWKKFERAWDVVIRLKQLSQMRPLLEAVLAPVTSRSISTGSAWRGDADDGSAALDADGGVDRGGDVDRGDGRAAAAALPLRGVAGRRGR
jgi:hypothetical protein